MTNQAPQKESPAKIRPAFFTPVDTKAFTKVALWPAKGQGERAPMLTGKINDVAVSCFLRSGPGGPFLSVSGPKQEDGNYENIGTANAFISDEGYARLKVTLNNGTGYVWCNSTMTASREMLKALGIDLVAMQAKRTQAQAQSKAAAEQQASK